MTQLTRHQAQRVIAQGSMDELLAMLVGAGPGPWSRILRDALILHVAESTPRRWGFYRQVASEVSSRLGIAVTPDVVKHVCAAENAKSGEKSHFSPTF